MNLEKYRPFIVIFIIAIIVGLAMILLAFVNTHQTSEQQFERIFDEELAKATEREAVAEDTFIAEATDDIEEMDEEEIADRVELLTIESVDKAFRQLETLPSELTTTELKLLGYYAILISSDFRDILTEDDVSGIIDELKQFQPEDIDKLLHHQKELLTYADNIKGEGRGKRTEEYGYITQYYFSYQKYGNYNGYKISISPTIDNILLAATKTRSGMRINYDPEDVPTEPLFMDLSYTKNNNIIPLIQFFLDNGVDVNMKNSKWGDTIFSSVGTLEMAQLLLAHGADPNITTNGNNTPLIHAISWGRSNELIKLLIDLGVDLDIRASYYGTALDTAKKEVEILQKAIWRTYETDDENPGDEFLSADFDKAETVVPIIENAIAKQAALPVATLPETLITPELKLLSYYAMLFNKEFRDVLTENDVLAIIEELKQFQPETVQKLLHHHQDILTNANNIILRVRKIDGKSQYYISYKYDDKSYHLPFSPMIDKILARDMNHYPIFSLDYNPHNVMNPLFTQLAFTKHDHMIPLIQYFLDNGVDINVRNPKNRKTIFSTLLTLKTAKFLLDKGADHKIIDADTDTPLISAIENEAANDLIKFLIDIGVYLGTKEYGMPFDTAESKVSDLERQHFDVEFRIRNDDMLESLNVRIDKARKVMRIIEQAIDVQTSESVELLSDELMTPELRLFGYSVVLKNKKFRDILTQNDVQAIIDELKQFQPTDIDKLLHHTENFLIYVDNVKKDIKIETQGKLKEYYLAYDADDGYRPYRISFSPTIDKILLRAKTEHSEMELYYNLDYMREPLFIQLAHTKNDHIIPLIQFFLDNGVDVNMRSQKWGDTIFSSVSTLKMTKFLASNGADPTIVTKDNDTPLIHAINLERSNELIKFLIDIGGLHVRSSDYPAVLDIAKWKVEYLKNKQLDMSDGNEQYASLSARRKKAEEVVRIIEQALEAEKKP